MKISKLKTEKRKEVKNVRAMHIQGWGEQNDYPQRVLEILFASPTGASCASVYRKFIKGRGFSQEKLYKTVVNGYGETLEDVLDKASGDLAHLGAVALHVNYNALYEVTSVCHVPVEQVRFRELDENFHFDKYAVHPDWGKRYQALRRFRQEDIVFFDEFNPDPDVIQKQVDEAGGWNGYKGQLLFWSNEGEGVYPTPLFEAVLTDMSSEEGLSNVTLRNVRNNFIPAGMLIDRDNQAENEQEDQETRRELEEFQGDTNSGKLLYLTLRNGEEAPEFKPFDTHTTDKDFTEAEAKTPQIIGRAFQQPPILRAEDVGANFGADLMRNAYDFYNSITETERDILSSIFKRVFKLWHDHTVNPEQEYEILPKVYRVNSTLAERLGANIDKVLELIFDTTKSRQAKEVVLKKIYGLEDEEVTDLLEGVVL